MGGGGYAGGAGGGMGGDDSSCEWSVWTSSTWALEGGDVKSG